jgi:hypothetical protein
VEREFRAYIGPNADYYLKVWGPDFSGQNWGAGLNSAANLPAVLISGFWLLYRKMYKVAFILFGILFAVGIMVELFVSTLKMGELPLGYSYLIVTVLVAIVVGIGANRWYLAQARRVISAMRAQGLSEEAHLKALSKQGGTNLGAALLLVAMLIWLPYLLRL